MSLHRIRQKFTVYDLVVISVMAALGVALKPVLVPLAHVVAAPMGIPAGSFAGGLYMMWLVVGFGITGKYGTGTLIGLVQAAAVLLTGVTGSHGIMALVSYTLPGIVMDLGLLLIRHRVCCRPCAFFAGMLANIAGTLSVNAVFFRLPAVYLILTISVAALSGGIGGILSWQLLLLLKKYHIGRTEEDEEDIE